MSEHRDTVTNRLAHVILTIELGGQTGTLAVERDTGMTLEEGWISFINGQVAWAKAGQRENEAAFNWLKTWATCRFAFIASTGPELTLPVPAQQFSPTRDARDSPYSSPRFSNGGTKSRVLEGRYESNGLEEQPTSTFLLVSTPYRTRQLDEGLFLINRLGLSRSHRHIFLLLDGHRTTMELASLIGRKPDELVTFLSDLEKAGVIHQ